MEKMTFITGVLKEAILKNGNLFMLSEKDGSIRPHGEKGTGLFYHDCRYLGHYELLLGEKPPTALMSSASQGFMGEFYLTNKEIQSPDNETIQKQRVGLEWQRTLDSSSLRVYDHFRFRNMGPDPITVPVTLLFQSNFEDLSQLRGQSPERRGTLYDPQWEDNILRFRYDGADGIVRQLVIQFSEQPADAHFWETTEARFLITLSSQEQKDLFATLQVVETQREESVAHAPAQLPSHEALLHYQKAMRENSLSGLTHFESDNRLLNESMHRALTDVSMFRMRLENREILAAGLPWFVTLFGRDSVIPAIQLLAFDPDIAAQTLRILAHYQGQQEVQRTHEEPGKMPHELRVGEMAHLKEIPATPDYISIDVTPLFLILLVQHAGWTGSLELFHELRDSIERALAWLDDYGDANGDGYVEYATEAAKTPLQQGWKDSGTAIVNKDGSLAEVPISLVEVQGYVYSAKLGLAELYRRVGESGRADELAAEAESLKQRFNLDYWMEAERFYCLALQKGGDQASVVTSNPGHALWCGIVDDAKARDVAYRLLQSDMFNGWGIRTLANSERAYNPINYHLGSVWPHDNSIVVSGLRRYGFDEAALKVVDGILEAASHFDYYRLPEFFTGFERKPNVFPARCPMADPVQAWSSAALPFMMTTLLGLQPNAFEKRLFIVRPVLPDKVDWVELRGLRVGEATLDLRFERQPDNTVACTVLSQEGECQVQQ